MRVRRKRRRCAVCGKLRIGAFFLSRGGCHSGSQTLSYTTGSDPRHWPRFRGWLCREHSTLEALNGTTSAESV